MLAGARNHFGVEPFELFAFLWLDGFEEDVFLVHLLEVPLGFGIHQYVLLLNIINEEIPKINQLDLRKFGTFWMFLGGIEIMGPFRLFLLF